MTAAKEPCPPGMKSELLEWKGRTQQHIEDQDRRLDQHAEACDDCRTVVHKRVDALGQKVDGLSDKIQALTVRVALLVGGITAIGHFLAWAIPRLNGP